MNVRQIVTKYLKENGYDGLYHDECGCPIDDLAPCDMPLNCKPGHKSSCNPETCPEKCGGWHIGPKQLHIYEAETNNSKGGAPMD